MANNSISLINLDFDTFKDQLKQYLRTQNRFSDYDFDGSNISVLLDILSYNTHLNAFYLNMLASEMFLDSAQLRSSVVSISKHLNYTPRSVKSSKTVLNLIFPQSGLSRLFIPAGTRFTGRNARGTYQFQTIESLNVVPSNNKFTITNLEIFEGFSVQESFVVDYSIENQRFILSNESIDTDSLIVSVSENGQDGENYDRTTSLFGLRGSDKVFYIQATDDNRYELFFGDDVLGARPKNGAVVTVSYRSSDGEAGNDSTGFILTDNIGPVNGLNNSITPQITVVSASFGGGNAEDVESIRTKAPRFFQTQERAITEQDYKSLILSQFQYLRNVYVYGGELRTQSPKFGTVFIAPITFTGEQLSRLQKSEIENSIRTKTTLGVLPEVVNPDFLFVDVSCLLELNPSKSKSTVTDVVSRVKSAIESFNVTELFNFNVALRTSRLETNINTVDPSVLGNTLKLGVAKIFPVTLFERTSPKIEFRNTIVPGTIRSNTFVTRGRRFVYVDFNPNVDSFDVQQIAGRTTIINTSNILYLKDVTVPDITSYTPAGTCDYNQGTLTLNSITISSLEDSRGIRFSADVSSETVKSSENDVLSIDNIVITTKSVV